MINNNLKQFLLRRMPEKVHFKLSYDLPTTLEYLFSAIAAEVEYRGGTIKESEVLNNQLRHVASWLCEDNTKNSLFLAAQCGNGKTTFLRAIQNLVTALGIKSNLSNKTFAPGLYGAKQLATICKSNPSQWQSIINQELIVIDDIGTEPREIVDFGNVINPIAELISYRYEALLPAIYRTNLSPSSIAEVYGKRVADRLKETAEIVVFSNESYRC